MNNNQYIEHEVQLRVLKETTESRFALMQKNIDKDINRLDHKINWLIGICLTSIVIPQLLRMINLF
jgi:hypothetical protein